MHPLFSIEQTDKHIGFSLEATKGVMLVDHGGAVIQKQISAPMFVSIAVHALACMAAYFYGDFLSERPFQPSTNNTFKVQIQQSTTHSSTSTMVMAQPAIQTTASPSAPNPKFTPQDQNPPVKSQILTTTKKQLTSKYAPTKTSNPHLSEDDLTTPSTTQNNEKNSTAQNPAHTTEVSNQNAEIASQNILDEYKRALQLAIDQMKFYPKQAKRMQVEGDVIVSFSVEQNGKIKGATILHTSGKKILDSAALAAVQKLKNFTPLPNSIGNAPLQFEVTLNYSLLDG
jgi:TonB family protein